MKEEINQPKFKFNDCFLIPVKFKSEHGFEIEKELEWYVYSITADPLESGYVEYKYKLQAKPIESYGYPETFGREVCEKELEKFKKCN